jgi:lysozyme
MSEQQDRTLGMDVSRYRGRIDWEQVREDGRVFFCFAKATQAASFVDPTFDSCWLGMQRIGLIRGAYHYFEPASDPVAQAENHLRIIEGILHPSDLPPVLDIEYWPLWAREQWDRFDKPENIDRIAKWMDLVESAIGRKPIIYTSSSSWRAITGDSQEFVGHGLWVANYQVASPAIPAGNWGGNGFLLWQFTDRGDIQGTNPPTDLNWFNGSLDELRELVEFTDPRPQPPQVTNLVMLLAARKAAAELGIDLDAVIENAGMPQVNDSRNYERPYAGLAVEEMQLAPEEASALKEALEEIAEQEAHPAELLTNQDVINGFFRAADIFGRPGWEWVKLAELEQLADDRLALYSGPAIEELPGLSQAQKNAVAEALGIRPIPDDTQEEEVPYPGLTNQGMINVFYKAASMFNLDGWSLIDRADLENMAASPTARAQAYTGPRIEHLGNISEGERSAIVAALESLFDAIPNPNP